jgi:hypothetical protein
MGIVFIVGGCIGILVAIFGKEFSVGDADAITSFNQKRSRRSGRLISLVAGLLLLAFGMKVLIVGQ